MTTTNTPALPTTSTGDTDERFARYSGILNPQSVRSTKAMIVGVGSIGRNISLQLAQMGVGRISLADHDTVDPVNLGTQGYRPAQVGHAKVEACLNDIEAIYPSCLVKTYQVKLPHLDLDPREKWWGDIVFLTTDTMSSRRDIVSDLLACQEVHRGVKYIVDVRMLGEVFQVRTVPATTEGLQSYLDNHIFDDSEAVPGTCSTRTTGYGATCAASFAVACFSKILRGMEPPELIHVDLFALELTAQSQAPINDDN